MKGQMNKGIHKIHGWRVRWLDKLVNGWIGIWRAVYKDWWMGRRGDG